jgi:5-methylcytosine-specific restriction endonuclease McrA
MSKDPRLERAGVSGYNKPKRTPNHPTKSHVVVAKEGDQIGSFVFLRTELVGKNKTWVMRCSCEGVKVFWKYSAIFRQVTCGCGTDEFGLTKEKRRMLKSRLHSYKSGARIRKIEWGLSLGEFFVLSSGRCTYCGRSPKRLNYFENAPSLKKDSPNRDWEKYTIWFNGVDRVDSKKGYVLSNCVPCCSRCNRSKNDMTVSEFKTHVERMYKWLHQTK